MTAVCRDASFCLGTVVSSLAALPASAAVGLTARGNRSSRVGETARWPVGNQPSSAKGIGDKHFYAVGVRSECNDVSSAIRTPIDTSGTSDMEGRFNRLVDNYGPNREPRNLFEVSPILQRTRSSPDNIGSRNAKRLTEEFIVDREGLSITRNNEIESVVEGVVLIRPRHDQRR